MKCTLREWQNYHKDIKDVIVQASVVDGSDSWQPWPIGMASDFAHYKDLFATNQKGAHSQLVLCCFNSATDAKRRKYGFNRRRLEYELTQKGTPNLPFVRKHAYWKALLDHKFIISPEGNGIDCHRHYEALMAGCIPIVEDHPEMRETYKGCPVLYTTKNYMELNSSYLEKKYNEMIDQPYDFSRLFLTHYSEEQQKQIKECGNYWMKKFANINQYYPL